MIFFRSLRFTSATFLGLVAIPLIHMGETADVGRRAGMLYSLNGVTLLAGSPIAGAIISRTGSYEGAGIYAGKCLV
jgi:MCP family monocarboxylic acid transporter-like MFS transporter 10